MTRTRVRAGRMAAVVVLTAAWVITAVAPASASDMPLASSTISLPPQAMDGALQVTPGASVRVGYSFTMPGAHPAATVDVSGAAVTFQVRCGGGAGGGTFTVSLPDASYDVPAGDPAWRPSGDQASAASYQGWLAMPDLCQGGLVSLAAGGAFSATVSSDDTVDPINLRWHYAPDGSAGGWSGTVSVVAGRQSPPLPTQIVVKVDLAHGYSIDDVISATGVRVDDGGLASRGIYLVSPSTPLSGLAQLNALATQIRGVHGVLYAQTNLPIQLADTQFYGWPYGSPVDAGSLDSTFTDQPAAQRLRLAAIHAQTQGAGALVAVLDTGADPTVPALAGHVVPGWNYVDDSADTADVPSTAAGAVNSAVGHGTFVSGLVSLVAPQARILPEKVLDSDGFGTIYGAAQAILDAVADGATVINISFGSAVQPTWNLLQDAIAQAQKAGVVVVAASGNDGDNQQHYPASQSQALAVAALDQSDAALAPFSDYGSWVDVAAPGQGVVGPLPGGGYATWAGTSMATPFVAGQVALLQQAFPRIQASKVFEAIGHSASKLPQIQYGSIDILSSLIYVKTHT